MARSTRRLLSSLLRDSNELRKYLRKIKGWNLQFVQDIFKFKARIFMTKIYLGSKGSKANHKLEDAD